MYACVLKDWCASGANISPCSVLRVEHAVRFAKTLQSRHDAIDETKTITGTSSMSEDLQSRGVDD